MTSGRSLSFVTGYTLLSSTHTASYPSVHASAYSAVSRSSFHPSARNHTATSVLSLLLLILDQH